MKRKLLSLVCIIFLVGCQSTNPTHLPTIIAQPTLEKNVALQSTAKPTSTFESEKFFGYAISPDKQTIAVSMLDGIYLYDSLTLTQVRFIERQVSSGFNGEYLPVTFSSDGKHIAFSDGYKVSLLNLLSSGNKPEKSVVSLIPSFEIYQIGISYDNSHIILFTKGSYSPCDAAGANFALYDLNSTGWGLVIDRYFCAGPTASLFRFTETGKAYFFFWYITIPYPYSMDVVDLATNALIENVNFKDIGYAPEKTFYDISPNGKIIASVVYKSDELPPTTKLINLETKEVIENIEGLISFTPYPSDKEPLWVNEWGGSWSAKPAPCGTTSKGHLISYNKVISSGDLSTFLVLSFFDLQRIESWSTSQCEKIKTIGEGK